MRKSDLPHDNEFSPEQVDLRHLLELVHQAGGTRANLRKAIRREYFDSYDTTDDNKNKLAGNTCLSMIAYGIIDRNGCLTPLGTNLYSLRSDETALYRELAQHILLHLNGTNFVHCIQDMQAAGDTVDLIKLRAALEERGIHVPRGGRHMSTMKLWLEKAGIFTGGYQVDEAALEAVTHLAPKDIEALAGLTSEQRAFLKALANLGGAGPYLSNEVERLATATYGIKFNEKNLPQSVLYPLRDIGYIELKRGTKTAGRGSKPFHVTPTSKLLAEVVNPLLEQFERRIDPKLRKLLRRSLSEILAALNAQSKHERGLALEALAFKLMRLIDLDYVHTRLTGEATGGAEVDVIFESSRLVFSRWQVQCKNTRSVSLDDVAKEVGLTHMLKSTVIVIVSTGQIGKEARRYANKVMTDSNLCVVMVDRADMTKLKQNPAAIVDVFNREAKHAMKIKALEI
jgi:site-specific DNA-methyltransferase (cytosine-N4-specific)